MQAGSYLFNPQIMSLEEMKQQLIERIQQGDEQLIRVLFVVSEALEQEENQTDVANGIIGYRVDNGQPLLTSEVDATFEAIVEDVKKGNYTEVDDLIKQRSARW